MDHDYDLFEKFVDGGILWRGAVHELEAAHAKLKDLAARSPNEFFIFHSLTQQTVARANVPPE